MSRRITQSGKVVLATAVVALIGIGGTAVAASTYDAENAHKVDGKHAVSASATVNARKGKLVATNSAGYLPNNIIVKALGSDRVDGKHAVSASSTVDARKGKLVATDSAGRLPNNIIAKAPDADRLDGLDSRAFAKARAFYTAYETIEGIDFEDEFYAGQWIGFMMCGPGDVAVDAGVFETHGQEVRGVDIDEEFAIVLWDEDAVWSELDMSLRCLDTNGDGGGIGFAASATADGADASRGPGLRQFIEP